MSATEVPDPRAINVALDVMESEAMLWLMSGSGHPEAHLATLRKAWLAYTDCGGKTWPHSTRDYLSGVRDLSEVSADMP
jgi:hypothetical protein